VVAVQGTDAQTNCKAKNSRTPLIDERRITQSIYELPQLSVSQSTSNELS
jgi:hypothetical protein